jgi:hypothetical protein
LTALSLAGKLKSGRVIYATFADANGVNPKTRPAVLLHDAEQLQDDDPIVVVPVSGTFTTPLADHEVALPHSNNPRAPAVTRLTKASVAVCSSWLPTLCRKDIVSTGGIVPPTVLQPIANTCQGCEILASTEPTRRRSTGTGFACPTSTLTA